MRHDTAVEILLPPRRHGSRWGTSTIGPRTATLDLVAIERVLLPGNDARWLDVGALTAPERREAIRQAFERGWSHAEVGRRLRVSSQSIRDALNEPIQLVPA